MSRKIYISDGAVSLAEYLPEDNAANFANWQDPDMISGYNFVRKETFEEFVAGKIRQRFFASIMLNENESIIGAIGLSREGSPPDLAIRVYKAFRGHGYGTKAFALGVKYSFETLGLEKIYAGCYPHNQVSMRMLKKCGFLPHPSGNVNEKHWQTGAPLIQYDFVQYNPVKTELTAKIVAGLGRGNSLVQICSESGVDKIAFYKKIYELIDDGVIPNVLTCYCGHDCAKCRTFHATLQGDHDMREGISAFYMSEFKQAIPPEKLRCFGGRSDESMESCLHCPFMACCREKGISACEKCPSYPCPALSDYEKAYVNKVNQI